MHAPYDRSRQTDYRAKPKSGLGLLILLAVGVVVLLMVAAQPKASIWISEAVQAEFGGSGLAEDMPVQTAQPDMATPMRTVHAR